MRLVRQIHLIDNSQPVKLCHQTLFWLAWLLKVRGLIILRHL
jgi:hypothetical protein